MKASICPKHNKPSLPSRVKRNATGCRECLKESRRKGRQKRAKAFDEGDIRCKKHPERKAKRCVYIIIGRRICNWCNQHKADGTSKPGRKRQNKLGGYKGHYKKSIQRRERYLGGTLYGLKLFERATGLDLFAMGLAR